MEKDSHPVRKSTGLPAMAEADCSPMWNSATMSRQEAANWRSVENNEISIISVAAFASTRQFDSLLASVRLASITSSAKLFALLSRATRIFAATHFPRRLDRYIFDWFGSFASCIASCNP